MRAREDPEVGEASRRVDCTLVARRPDPLPDQGPPAAGGGGGGHAPFPPTRHSLVAAVRAEDPLERARAWDALLRGYWKPVHRYLCLRWGARAEEAEDWTQEFLVRAIERGTFDGYEPERARFRTFLRVCLDRWVASRLETAARLKRGGGQQPLSLDAETNLAVAPTGSDPEELFHREWLRALFETALEALEQACASPERRVRWEVFARYDLGDGDGGSRPSYAELAAELSLPVTQVTNHLSWARRELRRLVLDELRRQTSSEEEFRDEARRALGITPA